MNTETEEREQDTHIPDSPTEADETPDGDEGPTTPSPDPDPDRAQESPANDPEESPATQSGGPGEATGGDQPAGPG